MDGAPLKKLILQEYDKLVSSIFLYQDQQVEFRFICIKLVLGAFAIIGALTIYNIGLSNDWLIGICSLLPLIALAPLMGILSNDLFLRERLKMGYFAAVLQYEAQHPWLPEVHPLFGPESESRDFLGAKQTSFYFGCIAVLMAISCVFLLLFRSNYDSYSSISMIVVSFVIAYIAFVKLVASRVKKITRTSHVHKLKREKKIRLEESIASFIHIRWKGYIEHFSTIKMRYKSSLFVVMSAVVIAYIYILQNQSEYSHVNKMYLITFMTIMAVIGSNLIRLLDLRVSHAQMEHLLRYSVRLEESFKHLPKPYLEVTRLVPKKKSPVFLDFLHSFLYYFLFNLSMLSIAFVTLFAKDQSTHSRDIHLLPISLLAVMFLWEVYGLIHVFKKSRI